MYIFSLAFFDRSMYMNFMTGRHREGFGKDTIYRFLKLESINWNKFTALLASKIIGKSIPPLTNNDRINTLIIDDTLFERPGAKKVELASKVFDHVSMYFKRGFRLLTLGWSEKEENLYLKAKEIDKRTVAHRIRTEARMKATEVLLLLLEQAKNAGIQATHVLFDTWF